MNTSSNLALKDLQKLIAGTRKTPLSAIETANLFKNPYSAEFILYLISGLNTKVIDPDSALVQAIYNAKKKEDLIAVALALRYGADPNLYVKMQGVGDIHILGFTYMVLVDDLLPILNAIVIMLHYLGSNPSMPIFDNNGGIIDSTVSLVQPLIGQTVLQWLTDTGYDTILPIILNSYDNVDSTFLNFIGSYIDAPDLINNKSDILLVDLVASHSVKVLKMVIIDSYGSELEEAIPSKVIDAYYGLQLSLDYLNLDSFERFVDMGSNLSYADTINLIGRMKKYKEQRDMLSLGQLNSILSYAVSAGSVFDVVLLNYLKEVDTGIASEIEKIYDVPIWKRLCKNSNSAGPLSDQLANWAFNLNLDPTGNKKLICQQVTDIMTADLNRVKEAMIERQKDRLESQVSLVTDYINFIDQCKKENKEDQLQTGLDKVLFENRALYEDVYDHIDVDLIAYRDQLGRPYLFLSPNYRELLDLGKNPYTNLPLPNNLVQDIENKLLAIAKWRYTPMTTFSQTIDRVAANDKVNNVYTDIYAKLFDTEMMMKGINSYSTSQLTVSQMNNILADLGITTDLNVIDSKDRLRSFKIIVTQTLDKDFSQEKTAIIINLINQ